MAIVPQLPRVLLEAGPADGPEMMSVPAVWRALMRGEVGWGHTMVAQPGLGGSAMPYPRGKVLRGSGSINAMVHLRGHRSAFDAWEAAGAKGWGMTICCRTSGAANAPSVVEARYRGVDGP